MNGTRESDTAPGERRTWAEVRACRIESDERSQPAWEVVTGSDYGDFSWGVWDHQLTAEREVERLRAMFEVITVVERAVGDEAAGFSEEAKARVVLLEDALRQAQNTVEFLHGCLTSDGYKYAYPEQTEQRLREWADLAPRDPACFHSHTEPGCESCAARNARFEQLATARAALTALAPAGSPEADREGTGAGE